MADIIPVKAIRTGADVTALGEMTPTDTIAASKISNTPAGNIAATNVQAAIEELDAEKLAIAAIDDIPVDGATTAPISSNWAYDHAANTQAHGISAFGATLVDDTSASAALTTLGAASDDLDNITLSRPSIRPSLLLDFANAKTLDPRITFTRSTGATYYDGKTVAKAEENLLRYSQEFDNAAWFNGAVTISANIAAAPDGSSTATLVVPTTVNDEHKVVGYYIAATNTAVETYSIYAKANGYNYITLRVQKGGSWLNAAACFNLGTGTVGTVGSDIDSTSIANIGNGWYRCSISYSNRTSHEIQAHPYPSDSISGFSYTGDGTSGIYIWGAQLEQRSSVTAYTPTTSQPITNYLPVLQSAAANVARFDHDPITGESKGLLIEEQRSNLLTYSEDFSNEVWTKNNLTVAANAAVAPDGTLTGDKLVASAVSGSHSVGQNFPPLANTTYTVSAYVKSAGNTFAALQIAFGELNAYASYNLTTGALTGISGGEGIPTITSVGNGFYRIALTATTISTAPSAWYVRIENDGSLNNWTGDGYSGIYLWGAQLEAGAFPTSYIKTTSAQVTRAADAASMTGTNFSSWFNNAEGTLYGEASPMSIANTDFTVVSINDSTINNRFLLGHYGSTPYETVISSGVGSANINSNYSSASIGSFYKVSGVAKVNDFAVSAQGTAVATDTLGVMPVGLNQLEIGKSVNIRYLNGTIKKLAYYPKRLTNAELQALTA